MTVVAEKDIKMTAQGDLCRIDLAVLLDRDRSQAVGGGSLWVSMSTLLPRVGISLSDPAISEVSHISLHLTPITCK